MDVTNISVNITLRLRCAKHRRPAASRGLVQIAVPNSLSIFFKTGHPSGLAYPWVGGERVKLLNDDTRETRLNRQLTLD